MIARLGNVIYWFSIGIAVLALGLCLFTSGIAFGLYGNEDKGGESGFIAFCAGFVAIVSWLLGRACLYILAGR